MTFPYIRLVLAGAAAASLAATSAFAHHSFAMYDLKKQVTLQGEVQKWHFTNPHTYIDVNVVENGKPVMYTLEGQQTRLMTRQGWKRDSLKAGDKVTIVIHPMKDGTKFGHFLKVTLPSGQVLGSAPTG